MRAVKLDQGINDGIFNQLKDVLSGYNLERAYAPADSVTVLVRRAVVVTPNCPDWGSLGTTDELIGEERDFGCITATALGSTLSDPSDLEGGRDPGAFDGEAVSKSVQRYRDGKTKEPVATNTQKGK